LCSSPNAEVNAQSFSVPTPTPTPTAKQIENSLRKPGAKSRLFVTRKILAIFGDRHKHGNVVAKVTNRLKTDATYR
jgi:hypothetical protein